MDIMVRFCVILDENVKLKKKLGNFIWEKLKWKKTSSDF